MTPILIFVSDSHLNAQIAVACDGFHDLQNGPKMQFQQKGVHSLGKESPRTSRRRNFWSFSHKTRSDKFGVTFDVDSAQQVKHYDPAGLVKIPKTPETQKYEKITKKSNPPPMVGGPKIQKNTKKYKNCHSWATFVFFRVFCFLIFGASPWVEGFAFVSSFLRHFWGFRGFWALYQARGIASKAQKCPEKFAQVFAHFFARFCAQTSAGLKNSVPPQFCSGDCPA